ncbi:MAG: glycosyltransferase family 2 protein [Bacteroidota bacterium]|jgi:glycosyltransferase involved in cell wall biosynthesis
MNISDPLVSIVLCTYNRVSLLPRAIHSVLRQSYSEWELIIIDDGSTDSTRRIVKTVIPDDRQIRYYHQKNKGLALARNAGLKKAKGEFITFIDSDDEYAADHLSLRVRYLMKHPRTAMIHGGIQLIGPRQKHFVVDLKNPLRKIHLRKCHIGGTFFMRKEVVQKTGGFRKIPFGEDFDLYTRAKEHFHVTKVPFPTYRYYLDADDRLCDVFTKEMMKR